MAHPSAEAAPVVRDSPVEGGVPAEGDAVVTGWALYLGMSWTWCIGMFLPVLLIRDYGIWSFVVFALPNVIGAAAMGWVIRSRQTSERFVEDHRLATGAFSVVTILFQAYFVGWICSAGGSSVPVIGGLFGGLFILMLLLMRLGRGLERWLALLAAVVSWALLVFVAKYRLGLGLKLPTGAAASPGALAALASVCTLGFGLCPYLDRTFHRARRNLSAEGARSAFGLGFGLIFFSMLFFTLMYADLLGLNRLRESVLAAIIAHMVLQTAFTSAAHGQTLRSAGAAAGVCVLAVGAFAAGAFVGPAVGAYGEEFGYRLFMSFYGLAAPAYVWLCVIPSRGRAPVGWQWAVLAGTILAAAPFYWLAFIEGRMPWAAVGVAVVLAARLLVGRAQAPAAVT